MTSFPFSASDKDAGRRRAQGLASGLLIVAATATLAAQGINWNLAGGAPTQTPLGERMRIAGALVSATSNVDAALTNNRQYLMFANYSAEFSVFDVAEPILAIDDAIVRAAALEVMVFLSDFNLTGTLVRRDLEDRIATAARCGR